MIANVKIAIGGGINEPRDALLTILYGLLTNPDQLEAVRAGYKWRSAFEEGVLWVAPSPSIYRTEQLRQNAEKGSALRRAFLYFNATANIDGAFILGTSATC